MGLGEMQHLAMLAVARCGKSAYGAAIRDELRDVVGKRVTVATVYVTLIRLEERGLLASETAPVEQGRGGRPRRVFKVTAKGWDALENTRIAMARMWEGVARP